MSELVENFPCFKYTNYVDVEHDSAPARADVAGHDRLLLVGNPTSRGGKAADRIEQASSLMDELGMPYEYRATLPDDGTVEMVGDAITGEGFRTVVYLGGDGTFNLVAKGICASGLAGEVRLGMLPSGTANDQGKSFGIGASAKALEDNVRIILAGHTIQMDVGEITALSDGGTPLRRDLFFDSVGWGLSAAILAFRNRELDIVRNIPVWREMYRDYMVYVRAAARELGLAWVTRDRFSAEVEIDGEVQNFERLADLIVSNTIIYAGEWVSDPGARADDGLFEVAPFSGVRDWTSKLIVQHKKVPLTEDLLNRIGVSHSPVFRGREIKIQIFRPTKDKRLPAQLDGDEFPQADQFEVRVHPRMLNIIVPEDFHWI
jgi:diacylglycerol kinase family enzyme